MPRRSATLCKFFASGYCWNADRCGFSHDSSAPKPLPSLQGCIYYKAGNCNKGDSCLYSHDLQTDKDKGDEREKQRGRSSRRRGRGRGSKPSRWKSRSPTPVSSRSSSRGKGFRSSSRSSRSSSRGSSPRKRSPKPESPRADAPLEERPSLEDLARKTQALLAAKRITEKLGFTGQSCVRPDSVQSEPAEKHDKGLKPAQLKIESEAKPKENIWPDQDQLKTEGAENSEGNVPPGQDPLKDQAEEDGTILVGSIAGIPLYEYKKPAVKIKSIEQIEDKISVIQVPPAADQKQEQERRRCPDEYRPRPDQKKRQDRITNKRPAEPERKLDRDRQDLFVHKRSAEGQWKNERTGKRNRSPSPWHTSQTRDLSRKKREEGTAQRPKEIKAVSSEAMKPKTPETLENRSAGGNRAEAAETLNSSDRDYEASLKAKKQAERAHPDDKAWYYIDPEGKSQGPASISQFHLWLTSMANDLSLAKDLREFQKVSVWMESMERRIPILALLDMHPLRPD